MEQGSVWLVAEEWGEAPAWEPPRKEDSEPGDGGVTMVNGPRQKREQTRSRRCQKLKR